MQKKLAFILAAGIALTGCADLFYGNTTILSKGKNKYQAVNNGRDSGSTLSAAKYKAQAICQAKNMHAVYTNTTTKYQGIDRNVKASIDIAEEIFRHKHHRRHPNDNIDVYSTDTGSDDDYIVTLDFKCEY